MKWLGLASFMLSFPAAIWLMMGNPFDLDRGATHDPRSGNVAARGSDANSADSRTSDIDLRLASSMTLKKINEIDEKIATTQAELRKNEADRNTVVQDLLKIQAKIDALVKSNSNL